MQKILKNQFQLGKFECFIILYLRLISNSITYGYQNKKVYSYFRENNIDIIIYRYIIFGNEYSTNILNETLLTLSFFYQKEVFSQILDGFLIFDGLSSFYKEKVEDDSYFKNLLSIFVFIYLKNKNFILPLLKDPALQIVISQKKEGNIDHKTRKLKRVLSENAINVLKVQENRISLFQNLILDDQLFESKRKQKIINTNFILEYIQFNLLSEINQVEQTNSIVSQKSENQVDIEKETNVYQILMNLTYVECNHQVIFEANIQNLILKYLRHLKSLDNLQHQQQNMNYILNSFINLATNRRFFENINIDHLICWI